MTVRVPSFAGCSKRQSASYATPYKGGRSDKLRGFYNTKGQKASGVVVTRPVTHAEATVPEEQQTERSSSRFNARMARFIGK